MDKQSKRYVKGSAKEAPFSEPGNETINLSLQVDDLQALLENNPEKHKNGYVQIVVKRKKETDQYGNTHMVYESTYEPKAKKADVPAKGSYVPESDPVKTKKLVTDVPTKNEKDDLPF